MKKYYWICLLFFTQLLSAQVTVTGTVIDAETSEPIPAALVYEKTTKTSTIANENGEYQITVATDAILVFRSLGFFSDTIAVNGNTILNVSLKENGVLLRETVITALVKRAKKKNWDTL